MQNVEANRAKVGSGLPCRWIVPPPLVGKHDLLLSFEQQTCAMPPFGSMHCPGGLDGRQFVQVAVQLPPPHESAMVWFTGGPAHGRGPAALSAVPVVNRSGMLSVPTTWFAGGLHELERV